MVNNYSILHVGTIEEQIGFEIFFLWFKKNEQSLTGSLPEKQKPAASCFLPAL